MTVAVPGADYSEYAGIGTEDIDASEFGIMRWKIDHNDGLFTNNMNDYGYEAIDIVPLALVKQRVFFPKNTSEENADPLCKSNNGVDGFPGELFPWEEYDFGPQEDIPLACASCNFAKWGPRNANGKSAPPPCKEMLTFSFMSLNEEVEGSPGVISLKGTSIGPAKKYISSFVQKKWPLFVRSARLSLEPRMYMGRKYYVIKFEGLDTQDPSLFADYAAVALNSVTFLKRPPLSVMDQIEISAELGEAGAAAMAAIESASPAPEPVKVAQPAPAEQPKVAPVAASRPRPSSATPSTPAANPAATSAPSAASARPAPARPAASVARPAVTRPAVTRPAAATPALTPEPEVVTGSVVEDDDDLPF